MKRGEKGRRETDTQDFPGTEKARVTDRNDREKGEGLNRISIFACLCIAE